MIDGETIVQILTLILTFIISITTLLLRARLIEQGKDIEGLKSQISSAKGKNTPDN